MALSGQEKAELAAMERELAEDVTLTGLAAALREMPHGPGRFRLPAAHLGWTLAVLLSAVGVAMLAGGLFGGRVVGITVAAVLAALFQLPVIVLLILTWRGRTRD